MLEEIFIWVLTVLVVPIYYTFQFLGDMFHALGRFFDFTAERILSKAADFADFILGRN